MDENFKNRIEYKFDINSTIEAFHLNITTTSKMSTIWRLRGAIPALGNQGQENSEFKPAGATLAPF